MRSEAGGGGGIADELRISSTDLWLDGSGSLGGDMRDLVAWTCGELGTELCDPGWWCEW